MLLSSKGGRPQPERPLCCEQSQFSRHSKQRCAQSAVRDVPVVVLVVVGVKGVKPDGAS